MGQKSAADHCPSELQFVDADDRRMTVTFRSASYAQPGAFHTTTLALLSGQAACSCYGAQRGVCWHQALIRAAWEGHEARALARRYTATQLRQVGAKAAHMIRAYRGRCWATLPADRSTVVACRQEFLARLAVEHPAAAGQKEAPAVTALADASITAVEDDHDLPPAA